MELVKLEEEHGRYADIVAKGNDECEPAGRSWIMNDGHWDTEQGTHFAGVTSFALWV